MKVIIEIGKKRHQLKKQKSVYDESCRKCSLKGCCGQGSNKTERQYAIYEICALTDGGFREIKPKQTPKQEEHEYDGDEYIDYCDI